MTATLIRTFTENQNDMVMVSHPGNRKLNQDAADIFSHNAVTVMALADGMGGHPRGEVASQIFIDCARLLLRKHARANYSAKSYITDVMQTADRKIKEFGQRQQPAISPRTTAVLVTIYQGQMQWSHLGDSRIYLFRHNRAHLRTLDHTPVEVLRLKGELEDADSQSKAIGRSGVSRCLGSQREVDNIKVTPPQTLQQDDLLLLCTDGVWSQLTQAELEGLMLQPHSDLTARTQNLVESAFAAGEPRSDNATALALIWHSIDNTSDQQMDDADKLQSAIATLQNLINKYR